MSISQYVVGGAVLFIGLSVAYVKWNERGVAVDKAEARTAIVRAECATNTAVDTTEALNQQIADLTAQVDRQKAIAAAEAKKSRQRLDAFNALARKIANAPNDENVPVPAPVEHVLDAARMRGAVPRDGSPDSANEDADDGAADTSGRDVPPSAEPTS